MSSGDRSRILAAWTEYRFKKHITFKILVKPQDFVAKPCINIIYMRISKHIWGSRFLKLFLCFHSETRILKE